MALEFPDWYKETVQILSRFEFDSDGKIQGNYIAEISAKIQGKQRGEALKKAAFILAEAAQVGKDAALELKTPFNEIDVIDGNREFIFENMPGLKHIQVLPTDSAVDIENSKVAREQAQPSRPSAYFF